MEIISVILVISINDSAALLQGETSCWFKCFLVFLITLNLTAFFLFQSVFLELSVILCCDCESAI